MFFERRLVFPAPRARPTDANAASFGGEDVFFASADGTRLHGQYFPHDQPRGQILYCHGNGTMVPRLTEYGNWMRNLFQHSVFIYDYRGYGLSRGKPDERGILADTDAAHQWLVQRSNTDADDVVIAGRSIGGALAVHAAASFGARALVLQNTFDTLIDTAARLYPWLPVRLVMQTHLRSIDRIGQYHGPLLQSHGTADQIVHFTSGQKLFEAANPPKQFFAIEGGRHNDHNPSEYVSAIQTFLDEVANVPQSHRREQ